MYNYPLSIAVFRACAAEYIVRHGKPLLGHSVDQITDAGYRNVGKKERATQLQRGMKIEVCRI